MYWLIHFLYSIYEWILHFKRKLKGYYRNRLLSDDLVSENYILGKNFGFQKLPNHIAFIVDTKPYYKRLLKDVSNLICFSFAFGIRYITIYDDHDYLKNNTELLIDCLSKKSKNFFIKEDFFQSVAVLPLCKISKDKVNEKNDIKNYYVFILSPSDGKQRLVDLSKYAIEEVKEHRMEVEQIDLNLVSSILSITENKNIKYSHPDYVVKYDSSLVMRGYSPWHLRYSEIYHTHKLNEYNFTDFTQALKQFSDTSQRFGK